VSPRLVIGLGNPGSEYAMTRHNVGWRCLDELVRRGRFGKERRDGPARVREGDLEGYEVVLARPTTYMNLSGRAGLHLTRRLNVPLEEVIVVHDDIDLPLGRLRVRRGGSAGGNRGVRSLIESWQSDDFVRVRVGVSRPPEGVDAVDHVLERFTPEEEPVAAAVTARAADAVFAILRDGLEPTMNVYNRKHDVDDD
jgi:PTH1 family peptidyl-tRNA hydrolase